jgi:uncharacterized membrane protein (UPF0127 family)
MLLDSSRPFYTVSIALILGLVIIIGYVKYQDTSKKSAVTIYTGAGAIKIKVEYADTPEKWEMGLKNRQSLPSDSGMFFFFSDVKNKSFTMKDVLIPLDVIFISPDGKVNEVITLNPCPKNETNCPDYVSKGLTSFVIEANAGSATRWKIIEGDILEIPGL